MNEYSCGAIGLNDKNIVAFPGKGHSSNKEVDECWHYASFINVVSALSDDPAILPIRMAKVSLPFYVTVNNSPVELVQATKAINEFQVGDNDCEPQLKLLPQIKSIISPDPNSGDVTLSQSLINLLS